MEQNQLELGIGPMSSEIIEATFEYSHMHNRPLMLIPSKNQIDYNGGYVNGWTTVEFMKYITEMRALYPRAKVMICRDHCGPGFNGNDNLDDVYRTAEEDIKCGFDLIHVDFCRYKGTREERFSESKKFIEFCMKLNPSIKIEVGTDENLGTAYGIVNLHEIEEEIDFFQSFCKPIYYVVQTGSLVKEMRQVGKFNTDFVRRVSELVHSKGMKLKEHNADYLNKEQIMAREEIVDAMNIAPQLGVVQSLIVFNKCIKCGIPTEKFIEDSYNSKKWQKWMYYTVPDNKLYHALVAGHYNFTKDSYIEIIQQLNDIHDIIISEIQSIIEHYGW